MDALKKQIVRHSSGVVAEERPLRPTLFIGLGGSGIKILTRFRMRLFERFGSPDYYPIFGFLGIDCDKPFLDTGGLGDNPSHPLEPNERVDISMSEAQIAALMGDLQGRYHHFDEWLPNTARNKGNVGLLDGAGMRRPMGRMPFIYHIDVIRTRIVEKINQITSKETLEAAFRRGVAKPAATSSQQQGVEVVIVGSVAGGTGSGTFLDCAFLVRHCSRSGLLKAEVGEVRGMLLLPDVFEEKLTKPADRARTFANGYGALRELEYFNGLTVQPFSTRSWNLGGPLEEIREQPFQVTYVFSRDNGNALTDPEEVYDLVADALSFSVGGSRLSAAMRSSWSNARAHAYQNEVRYSLPAYSPEDGGEHGAAETRYVKYERSWSTRYSSLGVSSVTLKLPELRRYAAMRLLRQVIEGEIGYEEAQNRVAKEVQESSKRVLEKVSPRGKSLMLDYERRILAQQAGLAAKMTPPDSEPQKSMHQDAEDEVTRQIASLHALSDEIANPGRPTRQDARRLIANARAEAKESAKLCRQDIQKDWDYRREMLVIDALHDLLLEVRKPVPDVPPQTERLTALDQWADLEKGGLRDFFGFGRRGLAAIQRRLQEQLLTRCRLYIARIHAQLDDLYVRELDRELQAYKVEVAQRIDHLQVWVRQYRERQEKLGQYFKDPRNQVLTVKYIGEEQGSVELDAEIDKVLSREFPNAESHQRLAQVRTVILDQLAARLDITANPPATILDVLGLLDKHSNIQGILAECASGRLFPELPERRNIFDVLKEWNVEGEILPKIRERSRAYWPLAGGDKYAEAEILPTKLAGGYEPPDSAHLLTSVKKFLKDHGFQWSAFDRAEGHGVEGDLVLVHEAHGFSLSTLRGLDLMKGAYDAFLRAEGVADRHVHVVPFADLPDLGAMAADRATAETKAVDTALMAILIDTIKWNDQIGSFEYADPGGKPMRVGRTLDAVAWWLRTGDGVSRQRVISDAIMQYLAQRRQSAVDETSARRELRRLIFLDSFLDLLKAHNFPERKINADSGLGQDRVVSPPEHTRVRRLHAAIAKSMGGIIARYPALADLVRDQSPERRGILADLHKYARFVGPEASGDDVLLDEAERTRRRHEVRRGRMLVPAPTKSEGRHILDEALALGWFEDDPAVQIRQDVTSLFPDVLARPVSTGAPGSVDYIDDIGQGGAKPGEGGPREERGRGDEREGPRGQASGEAEVAWGG
jgi:hypothetical protein